LPAGSTRNTLPLPPVPRYMFPAASATLDQMYGCSVLNISVSLGAKVIVPFWSIETPRASPLRTSERESTVHIEGSAACNKLENKRRERSRNRVFFIYVEKAILF